MTRRRELINDLGRAAGHVERATAPARDIAATGQRLIVRLALIAAVVLVLVVGLVVAAVRL